MRLPRSVPAVVGAWQDASPRQHGMTTGSFREAGRHTPGSFNVGHALRQQPSAVTQRRPATVAGTSGGPSSRVPWRGSTEELQELEQLRRKNFRLERDLLDTLQSLEEESVTSTPSSSRSTASSPRPCSKPNALAAKKMQELMVCTSRPGSASPHQVVDTPPVAFCGAAVALSRGGLFHGGDCKDATEAAGHLSRAAPRALPAEVKSHLPARQFVARAGPQPQGCGSPDLSNSPCMLPVRDPPSSSRASGTVAWQRPDKAMLERCVHEENRAPFEPGTPGASDEDD